MTKFTPLVDGAWRVAISLGPLGRRVIVWFAPLRSAIIRIRQVAFNLPIYPIRRVCSTTLQQE